MRNILIISALYYILVISCSKNSTSLYDTAKPHADSLVIIMNNWKFVQDSLSAYHNTFHDSVNTIGKESDTWNFNADNILEINETNGLQTTVSWEFTNDSKLNIPLSVNPEPATIILLNSNNLIFYWEDTISIAHEYYRKIVLKR